MIFPGKLLVERSRDPECDAARALVAKGITGKLTMLDGETGKPRTIIDIEKAARLTAEEGPNAPRYRRFRGMEEAPTRLKAVGLLSESGGSFHRPSEPALGPRGSQLHKRLIIKGLKVKPSPSAVGTQLAKRLKCLNKHRFYFWGEGCMEVMTHRCFTLLSKQQVNVCSAAGDIRRRNEHVC